jgi:pimeloyl-ACP methyl ester carboxylesterase
MEVLRCTIENLAKLVNYFDARGTRFLRNTLGVSIRLVLRFMRLVAIIFLILAAFLFLAQRRLMYFSRKYPAGFIQGQTSQGLVPVKYETSRGTQWVYYRPPAAAGPGTMPDSIWVLFGGNGSLALDWLMFLPTGANLRAGLLFVDYPGYGECDGATTRAAINESLAAVVPALAVAWKVPPAEIARRLSVAGHSLGAAVALEFAQLHPVRDIVLIAPFTSMKDMARRSFGWPLCEVLLDRYDNRASLDVLAARSPRPGLRIYHGAADMLIPADMSRELAQRHPGWANYRSFPGRDHMDVVNQSAAEWIALLR